ncbi:MAG: GGDEF domain-containing protein [Gammaproteobacteria bacterium]|nr:GGDEF domain-containing protein [Gammaproteobacteria bacterium]
MSIRKAFLILEPGSINRVFLSLLLLTFAPCSWALPQDVSGTWYTTSDPDWQYQGQSSLDDSSLRTVAGVELSGGNFWFEGYFDLSESTTHVLDFKNSSTIGHFRHFVFDEKHQLLATSEGGIQSHVDNPFFMRHGREVSLPPGRYRLISELSSPFFLAQPEPYVDSLADYRRAIKSGNALVLIGFGIFFGLGIYYAALSLTRRRTAEGMYALFILGNIFYNGTALLVFAELFDLHWFYLISVPILFSNFAYIAFVMSLLSIDRNNHPHLYRMGIAMYALLGMFIILAAMQPGWSLEYARYGVALFLLYGLTAGIVRARQGNISARLYLIAIAVFFILGGLSISMSQLSGMHAIYVEHVGLFAVAVEVILLALVLSYQFARLQREKEHIQKRLKHSNHLAKTDALTGLSNRYALDKELDRLSSEGSLTFIDLDRLKYYNDQYGHARGDELLCRFSRQMNTTLGDKATIYRVGGDEFAITCPDGDVARVERIMSEAVASIQSDFEFAGASAGSAYVHEADDISELKHLADMRMYQNKQQKRLK